MRCKGVGCQCFDGDDCVKLPPQSSCNDPTSCGEFCFGLCAFDPPVAQCDLENPEYCEACQ